MGELRSAGHTVSRLARSGGTRFNAERLIAWNPERGTVDAAALEGHDVLVHLAGESLFALWTQSKKTRIRESRIRGTSLLARTAAGLRQPPRLFISASAVGYYGSRSPDDAVTEDAARGEGFLAELSEQWEQATAPAASAGIRVVNPRFGLVLSTKGGALRVMLPIFQAGLGGKIGSGEQVWSWIALPDAVRGIQHVITTQSISGPTNFTAPGAVSNKEFTRTLGRVLHRPAVFTAPSFAVKLLGQQADELLLSGVRAIPRRLLDSGFRFQYPQLESALVALLARR
jgi:uncharacterized protein (TIGR01777 family)